MAEIAALRTALQRMGFSAEAAGNLTDVQGLDSLNEFELLDDDEVANLCKTVRRPGGATVVGGNQVPNPGIMVTPRAETNLKLMVYFLRYRTRTSRPVTAADITLERVRALKDHRKSEKEHTDVDAPSINNKDWPKTIESIEEFLRGRLGVTKIPLAYVIRDDVTTPDAADDPPTNYISRNDELIHRAPIQDANGDLTATYLTDRATVWELISEICRDHDCFSYIRPAQRSRDGRMAFHGLKGHYLGVNSVDNMSSEAERKLSSASYHGETRRWTFERYVKVHVDQHAILNGLRQHGYSGIDERSKVRILLNGIKTNKMDTVKTTIMADATLRNDFDRCVNLFKDFILQTGMSQNVRDANVSALHSGGPSDSGSSNGNRNVEPDMTVEDRYYTSKEYKNLTKEKRLGLKRKREQRGHKSGSKQRGGRKTLAIDKRTIKAIATEIANTVNITDGNNTTDDESDSENEDRRPTKVNKRERNRDNGALQRNPPRGNRN
jgi:hypothetical protein